MSDEVNKFAPAQIGERGGRGKIPWAVHMAAYERDAATQRRDFLEQLTQKHEAEMITMRETIQEAISQRDTLLARVKMLEDALKEIDALDFDKNERGRDDFYSGPKAFIKAALIARAALATHVEGQG